MTNKIKYTVLYLSMVIYMISVIGVTINMHFCEGELESVTLIEKSTCCEGETEDEPAGCCSNESVHIANSPETITSAKVDLNPDVYALYCTVFSDTFFYKIHDTSSSVVWQYEERPPLLKCRDTAELMVFRI